MYDIKFVPCTRPFRIAYMVGLAIVAVAWVGWPGVAIVALASVDINMKD